MRSLVLASMVTIVAWSGLKAQKPVDLVITTLDNMPVVAPAQSTATLATSIKRRSNEGLLLRIACREPHDCRAASAALMVDPNVPISVNAAPGATERSASIQISANQLPSDRALPIRIRLDQKLLEPEFRTEIGRDPADELPLVGSHEFPCSDGFNPSTILRGRNDLKAFVTNSIGNVVSRPAQNVDADDRVVVITLGPAEDAGRIRIRRISDFGLPGQIDILGAGAPTEIIRQTTGLCAANYAILGDFAAGKGEVEIARVDDAGTAQVVSTFDFGVDHLYSGAFSFGPVITGLRDRDYAVSGDTLVFESRNYDNGGRYVLAYTHFVWGRRNLDSSGLDQLPQINPFIAIGTRDVFDNVMGGAAIDLFAGSVYLLVGGHGGRVNTLVTSDSVGVGNKWRSAASTLPIRKEWDWAWFGGLTVDLRAAVQLFTRILGTGTGR